MQTNTTIPHILIIDDDMAMLQALPEVLRRQLYPITVTTARSAQHALQLVSRTDFDAIISDIRMPGMDGLTLIHEIHQLWAETPVLIMTAEDNREVVVRALRAGAYDFISKPIVDHDYMVVALQRAIRTRQLSRQVAAQKIALEHHNEELESAIEQAVSEAKAAQRRLSFLAEASSLLASSLDYEATMSRLARLAVLYLSDYCVIDMLDELDHLQNVAVAHRDRNQEKLMKQLRGNNQAYAVAVFHVLEQAVTKTGHGVLQSVISETDAPNAGSDLRALGIKSAMIVPLIAGDKIVGSLMFLSTRPERHYSLDDLNLAEDLTRRASLAINNARLYNEAQQALRVRDQFLSIAAHELKTPITSIMGTAQLLQRSAEREGSANPRDIRRLQLLNDQTRRLNRLLDSLLNLSRLEAGQLTIDQNEVDIVTLSQRTTEEIRIALESHTIEFFSEEDSILIAGDELRLEQVLQNLLQNAIKYSPDGGTVRVEVRRLNDMQATISVSDQGMGIPSEAIPLLFSRFYRAESPSAKQISGIGLGLYVVKEIVTMHGGAIEVASTEGKGSTFTFRLPLFQGQPE